MSRFYLGEGLENILLDKFFILGVDTTLLFEPSLPYLVST